MREPEEFDRLFESADLLTAGVSICQCESSADAKYCGYLLSESGIASVVVQGQGSKFDLRWPQVKVAPEDEERAREIVLRPVDPEKRGAFEEETAIQPSPLPVCLKCGSAEILLEGVDPSNQWYCEDCGERWADEAVVQRE